MNLPQRKPNRIPDYDYSLGGCYFVTICTQNRARILSRIVGDGFPVPTDHGNLAEAKINEIPLKYPGVFVEKYVIMPDHIHLLLRIEALGTGNPSPTVGTIIGWYKYETTKLFNNLQNTPGQKHFQRSYYDHVIRNQQDHNEIWEYIENNPRKWAMQKQGRD